MSVTEAGVEKRTQLVSGVAQNKASEFMWMIASTYSPADTSCFAAGFREEGRGE